MCDNERTLRSNNSTKGPTTSNDMSVGDLANLMKSQFSAYQRSTKEEIKTMGDKLSTEIDILKRDITSDVDKLREETKKIYAELTSTINTLESDTTQALESSIRANDLIVSGIPFVQGEDLMSYFNTWCSSLGYSEEHLPMVDVRRLIGRSSNASNAPNILIQFAITVQRNDFYARYLRSRRLVLSDIGFSVNKRIYVNENLGPAARAIRSKALRMKKDGRLYTVFTRNGAVYVKRNEEDRGIAVKSSEELDHLLHAS